MCISVYVCLHVLVHYPPLPVKNPLIMPNACLCVCVCMCACSCYFSHLRGDIERPVVCNPTLLPMGVIQGHGARSISGLHQGRVSQLSVITLNHTPSTEGHKRVPAGMA